MLLMFNIFIKNRNNINIANFINGISIILNIFIY